MNEDLIASALSVFISATASLINCFNITPDKRSIVKTIKRFAKYAEEAEAGKLDREIEQGYMTYEEQKRICAKHGFICLEDYRRNGAGVG